VLFDDTGLGENPNDRVKPLAVGGRERIGLLGDLSHPVSLGAIAVGGRFFVDSMPSSISEPVVIRGLSAGPGTLQIVDAGDGDAPIDEVSISVEAVASVGAAAPAADDYQDAGPPADLALWLGSEVSIGLRLLGSDQARLVDTGLRATSTSTSLDLRGVDWDLLEVRALSRTGSGSIALALSDGIARVLDVAIVSRIDDLAWVPAFEGDRPFDQPAPGPDRTLCFRALSGGRMVRGVTFEAQSSGTSPQVFPRSAQNCFALDTVGSNNEAVLTVSSEGYSKSFNVALR
jgi:hypothetical protein